jgi:P63C domain
MFAWKIKSAMARSVRLSQVPACACASGIASHFCELGHSRILEAFVAKELQPWVKTFPDEFYAQLFRLRGLEYKADSVKRPQYFGTLTNDIVWKRIAPGVLTELKRVIPKTASGRRKANLSQALTRNIGYPKLREHLGAAVAAYMTVSPDYPTFIKTLDAHRPRFQDQMELPFDYRPEEDDGRGL